jgi:hypothetical protein
MTFRYRYFPEIGCLHTVGKGKVSIQDFLDYHLSIKIDNPKSVLRILADYRELDPSNLKTSDIEKIKASALSKVEKKYAKVREATVVSDPLTWGLSRQYDGSYYSEVYELQVFTDIDEARNWLELDPATNLTIDA